MSFAPKLTKHVADLCFYNKATKSINLALLVDVAHTPILHILRPGVSISGITLILTLT